MEQSRLIRDVRVGVLVLVLAAHLTPVALLLEAGVWGSWRRGRRS
jgi:hypothetical protein